MSECIVLKFSPNTNSVSFVKCKGPAADLGAEIKYSELYFC